MKKTILKTALAKFIGLSVLLIGLMMFSSSVIAQSDWTSTSQSQTGRVVGSSLNVGTIADGASAVSILKQNGASIIDDIQNNGQQDNQALNARLAIYEYLVKNISRGQSSFQALHHVENALQHLYSIQLFPIIQEVAIELED